MRVLLLVLTFIAVTLSQTDKTVEAKIDKFAKESIPSICINDSDTLVFITFPTSWRTHISYSSYRTIDGFPLQNNALISFVLNKSQGIGVMLDLSKSISSIYKIENFIYKINTTADGDEDLILYGSARSDANRDYVFVLNDSYSQLTFQGNELPFIVIRQYYDPEVSVTTAGQYLHGDEDTEKDKNSF